MKQESKTKQSEQYQYLHNNKESNCKMRQTNDKKETRLPTNIVYKRLSKEKTETEQIMQHQYFNEGYINKHWLKIVCTRNKT